MQMLFPDQEIINLIKSLEDGTCSIPESESDGVSPRAAADARMEGIKLKRDGELIEANNRFLEMLSLQDSISSDGLWSWGKVLILAKDFRSLQLLMHADYANLYRGREWFNPFVWMNIRLNMPGLDIEWLFDDSEPNYKIYELDYFDNPMQLVERIYTFGGNDGYWKFNYSWSPEDYQEFLKYFGPLAVDVMDGQAYRWTNDDVEVLQKHYQQVLENYATRPEETETEAFSFNPAEEYRNERGLEILPVPDEYICDLISMLEGDCCPLPSAGNPPTLETDVAKLFVDAERKFMQGDLKGAHENFLNILELQNTLASMILDVWAKVLLVSKDFGHAQLILNLSEANIFRGEKWFTFGSNDALNRILNPLPQGLDMFQALSFKRENQVDFNDKTAVEVAISKLVPNHDNALEDYNLSDEEFQELRRYFGDYSGDYRHNFVLGNRSY